MQTAARVPAAARVVRALHGAVGAREEQQALEGVAAVARHVVDLHAAAGQRRVGAGRVDRHLLHRGEAGRAAQRFAEANRRRSRHAADRLPLLGRLSAVNRQVREGVARRAADVLRGRASWCWPTPTPPPAPRMMPGCSAARLMPRRPVGTASTTSFVTTFCTLALRTSTSGVWPVTVMVSASSPTFISAFTVATNEPPSSIPSRLNVLNPGSVNVTV